MSPRRQRRRGEEPPPGKLGLPESSALTVEGGIERAGLVGTHLVRSRDGREQAVWRSGWAAGLWLILGVLAAVIALTAVLSLV